MSSPEPLLRDEALSGSWEPRWTAGQSSHRLAVTDALRVLETQPRPRCLNYSQVH